MARGLCSIQASFAMRGGTVQAGTVVIYRQYLPLRLRTQGPNWQWLCTFVVQSGCPLLVFNHVCTFTVSTGQQLREQATGTVHTVRRPRSLPQSPSPDPHYSAVPKSEVLSSQRLTGPRLAMPRSLRLMP